MTLRAVLFAALFIISACDNVEFPKYNVLGGLRVLTIVVDRPEANPGETVTFTPVLSDVNGQGREIGFSVHACIDPGVGVGAEPACATPDPSSIQTGTVTIPAGPSQTYTGPVSAFTLTLPDAATMFAGRNVRDQYNGVAYLVFYTISASDGAFVNSFVRVLVTSPSKTQKNLNPAMNAVELNGTPVTAPLGILTSDATFRITASAGAAETYQFMLNDGSFKTNTEELITTWFVSDGTFDFLRTIGESENVWKTPDPYPSGRGIVILAVTRDGRGGAVFQRVDMR